MVTESVSFCTSIRAPESSLLFARTEAQSAYDTHDAHDA